MHQHDAPVVGRLVTGASDASPAEPCSPSLVELSPQSQRQDVVDEEVLVVPEADMQNDPLFRARARRRARHHGTEVAWEVRNRKKKWILASGGAASTCRCFGLVRQSAADSESVGLSTYCHLRWMAPS